MSDARLEYKRTFYLQNISDVKKRWYQMDALREKLIFLFLTVWFGTIAVYLSNEARHIGPFMLSTLLIIMTVVFLFLETHYSKISRIRLYRISIMEEWMTTASDQDILNLNGPLSELPSLKQTGDATETFFATTPGLAEPFILLYMIFFLLSVVVGVLFYINI